jgi:transposase
MRPFGSPKQLEKRRRKAMELLDDGLSLNEVARRIGCAPPSVMRWRNARDRDGERGLAPKPVPGRPSKLTDAQKERLERLLLKGAMAQGYPTDLWTTQRIADVIEKRFGVSFHRDHIGRLMKSLGWSHQKPERKALERDEERIRKWKAEAWPRIKKMPRTWAPTSSS